MQRLLRKVMSVGLRSKGQPGQALILFVFAFVALLAVVGIAVDVANIYVQFGHLRRAVDAGLLAAVGQYREGRKATELHDAVLETMRLQLPNAQNVRFHWCHPSHSPSDPRYVEYAPGQTYDTHDDALCTVPPRKLVRVEADVSVDLIFLSLVWGKQVTIHNQAQAEAAVLNLVLAIDTSESMAYTTCPQTMIDPYFFPCVASCRAAGSCQPFDGAPSVRWAANAFVKTLMRDGVDRFAVYHFDKTPVITPSVEMVPCIIPSGVTVPVTLPVSSGRVIPLTTTKQAVLDAIDDTNLLNVYMRPPAIDFTSGLSCTDPLYVGGWWGQEGDGYGYRWASTNIGGGLREAIGELVNNGSTDAAIWVIVLLSDGSANATDQAADVNAWWTCPSPPGSGGPNERNLSLGPFCRDKEAPGTITRHCPSLAVCNDTRFCDNPPTCTRSWYTNWGETITNTLMWSYDADDYARDIADMASSHQIGIYTIGFGPLVAGDGEELLRYIADVGDDGDLRTAPCGSDWYWDDVVVNPLPGPFEQCGNYYYAPDAAALERVLEDIARRIFSRITE